MYIKIKNLKKVILIAACIVFAGVNYLNFVKADTAKDSCNKAIDADCDGLTNDEENAYGTDLNNEDTDGDGYSDGVEVKSGYDPRKAAPDDRIKLSENKKIVSDFSNESSLTDEFSEKFKDFIASKSGTAVSTEDVNNFIDSQFSNKISSSITYETLPEIDTSGIAIIAQTYSGLSDEEKKKKMQEDARKYLISMTYILISNAPVDIESSSDLEKIKNEFQENLKKISDASYDGEYFYLLAQKVELALAQMEKVEVPESMLDLHVKFLRLAKGLLVLRDEPSTVGDPIARIATVSKAASFFNLYADFFQNDFRSYFEKLN